MLSFPDFKQKQILFLFANQGDRLFFRNDNIVIKNNNTIRHQSSAYRLFALYVVGNTTITTPLLMQAKRFGISLFLMSYSFRLIGSMVSGAEGNFLLRSKQYSYEGDAIACHLIQNKILHQIEQLQKIRDKTPQLKEAIVKLKKYRKSIFDTTVDAQTLLGIEGSASRIYFKHMFASIGWSKREPRTKRDIPNLLLDIGYTLLFHMVDAILNIYGFDTYKGVYHKEFYQRKSLVSDIMEPFRPIIDKRIKNAYALNQIRLEDFEYRHGQYSLSYKNSKHYVSFMLEEIVKEKDLIFLYIQRYYRAFMRQLPIESYPILTKGEVC